MNQDFDRALNRIGLEPIQTFYVVFNAMRDDMITVLEQTKGVMPQNIDMHRNLTRVGKMAGKLLDALDALKEDNHAD